jgi:1,5-anhydro-D-fructose reductase (1,5-anhydro-D-mannitol-forming)
VASWNFAGAAKEDFFQFTGTEGRLTFSTFGNEPLRLETAAGVREFEFTAPPHVGQPLIQTVVDDLRGKGKSSSTGESAARTSRVLDWVLESFYGGREDGFWFRQETWPGRRVESAAVNAPSGSAPKKQLPGRRKPGSKPTARKSRAS